MDTSKLRQKFAELYPNLTDEELDLCCTNMMRFVSVVLKIMDHQAKEDRRDKLPDLPDSTLS